MNTFPVHIVNSRGVAWRRFARRIVSFSICRIRRHVAAYLPLWDGTDPALRGRKAHRDAFR